MRILSTTMVATAGIMLLAGQAGAQDAAGVTAHRAANDGAFYGDSEYWTPERRANAEPLPWNEEPILESDFLAPRAMAATRSRAVPGGAPDPEADLRASEEFPLEWNFDWDETGDDDGSGDDRSLAPGGLGGGGGDEGEEEQGGTDFVGTYSAAARDVFDAFPVNRTGLLQLEFPHRAMGKLNFRTGQGDASCSASVISRNNVIVTAAHCCYDRTARQWNALFTFTPAAAGTSAPYGVFPYEIAWVPTGWINTGGRPNDVCVLRLRPNSAGRPVTFYTGWLGRSQNAQPTQHHFAFGYPGNIDGGRFLQTCASESFPLSSCGGTDTLNTGCNMTHGSSGGPWLLAYRPFESGPANYVNGVVSGRDLCTGPEGRVFNAARFTDRNIGSLCRSAGC